MSYGFLARSRFCGRGGELSNFSREAPSSRQVWRRKCFTVIKHFLVSGAQLGRCSCMHNPPPKGASFWAVLLHRGCFVLGSLRRSPDGSTLGDVCPFLGVIDARFSYCIGHGLM